MEWRFLKNAAMALNIEYDCAYNLKEVNMQNKIKQLLKNHKDYIPRLSIGMMVRLSGLDDGSHIGECQQMVRDLSTYPALEAALLGYGFMEQSNADRFAIGIIEYLGLSDKPICECCDTRNEDAFGANKKLCLECIANGAELEECTICGKTGYKGDTFCILLVGDQNIVETFEELGFDVNIGDKLTPEMIDTFATVANLDVAVRTGMIKESWDTCDGAIWICQHCLDKGKGPEDVGFF